MKLFSTILEIFKTPKASDEIDQMMFDYKYMFNDFVEMKHPKKRCLKVWKDVVPF